MTNVTIELPGLSDWLDAMEARNDGVEKELSYIRADLENCRAILGDVRLHSFPPFEQVITPHKGEVDEYDII